jgi:hypothetical protein
MNDNGTTAIAKTNVIEAAGGIIGVMSQFYYEQGSAVAAIASSAGVIGVMGAQIVRERSLMQKL